MEDGNQTGQSIKYTNEFNTLLDELNVAVGFAATTILATHKLYLARFHLAITSNIFTTFISKIA